MHEERHLERHNSASNNQPLLLTKTDRAVEVSGCCLPSNGSFDLNEALDIISATLILHSSKSASDYYTPSEPDARSYRRAFLNHQSNMSTIGGGISPSIATLAEKYSCVICHKRKVKCDRAHPCANCVKNNATCQYLAPPPPKRKKRKASDEALRSKVAKYEEQMRDLGLPIDHGESLSASHRDSRDASQRASPMQVSSVLVSENRDHKDKKIKALRVEEGALLVDSGGKARYVDNNLWMTISDELPNQRPLLQDQHDGSTEDESEAINEANPNALLFGGKKSVDALSFYPRSSEVMAFWRAYKENVDPLTKVIHRPTLEKLMQLSCQNIHAISRNNITLLFAMHHIAAESMLDEQCRAITGESRITVRNRLAYATQLCLTKCGVLRSSDLTILVALVLHVQALRTDKDAQTISTLMSVVITTAQRIGLHRDITAGLRPYDIEMRRRTWKQILILDWICSEVAGLTPFHAMYPAWWAQPDPRNLNDEDFDINTTMEQIPASKAEPTEMFICQMRYNFGSMFIAHPDRILQDHGGFADSFNLVGNDLESRDRAIDQLEKLLQDRFLRYAEPIDPVHNLVSIVARSAVASMRIRAHHPRQYADAGASLPASEHERLYGWSLQSVQYDNLFFTTPSLVRFRWHSRQLFQYHPLIYLLTAIRSKRVYAGPNNTELAWTAMDTLFQNRPELLEGKHVLHIAMAMLAVKAWEVWEKGQRENNRLIIVPSFINRIRAMTDAGGIPRQTKRKSYSSTTNSDTRSPMITNKTTENNTNVNTAVSYPNVTSAYNLTGWDNQQNPPWPVGGWTAPTVSDPWANWEMLMTNPEMPVEASFNQSTFQMLDGYFAPIQDPPRTQ